MSIQSGDVVRLKSGGPEMTAGAVTDWSVECYWFRGSNPLSGHFHIDSLVKESPPKGQEQ